MNWGLLLKMFLGCIASGWLLGESIKDYKAGRYHLFGIDLMYFVVFFIYFVMMTLFGHLI